MITLPQVITAVEAECRRLERDLKDQRALLRSLRHQLVAGDSYNESAASTAKHTNPVLLELQKQG